MGRKNPTAIFISNITTKEGGRSVKQAIAKVTWRNVLVALGIVLIVGAGTIALIQSQGKKKRAIALILYT